MTAIAPPQAPTLRDWRALAVLVLLIVVGVGALAFAATGLTGDDGLSVTAAVATVAAVLYLASAGGLYTQKTWAWGLIVFLCIMGIVGMVFFGITIWTQVSEAMEAGVALNVGGILTRVALIVVAIAVQVYIIGYLAEAWTNVPINVMAIPYVGPTMIGVLAFSVYPILYNVWQAFTNRNVFRFKVCPEGVFGFPEGCPSKGYTYIGLENFTKLFSGLDSDFFVVMWRSLYWTVICVSLFLIVGFVLALLLNSEYVKAKGFYRMMLIIPWAIPFYISALVWKFFFNGQFGLINVVLRDIGIANPPTWLQQPTTAFIALVIINLWMSYPFFMTIILGALQAIPAELYEAADVDGANWWDRIKNITIPLIRPAVMPGIVLSSLTTFKLFETVWMVTKGEPRAGAGEVGSTEFVMVYAFNQAFQQKNYGYIAAFAVVLFILLFAATMASMRFTRITAGAAEQ